MALLGVQEVLLAVNKMDRVGWDPAVFARIEAEYHAFAARAGVARVTAVPSPPLREAMSTARSPQASWHSGPTLLEWLESVDPAASDPDAPFLMPVQWVNRAGSDFRGYSGSVLSGRSGRATRCAPCRRAGSRPWSASSPSTETWKRRPRAPRRR
jgi:bifunctional enzyme CysN/CysC